MSAKYFQHFNERRHELREGHIYHDNVGQLYTNPENTELWKSSQVPTCVPYDYLRGRFYCAIRVSTPFSKVRIPSISFDKLR